MTKINKICPYCNKSFTPKRSDQIYCSTSHRVMNNKAKARRKNEPLSYNKQLKILEEQLEAINNELKLKEKSLKEQILSISQIEKKTSENNVLLECHLKNTNKSILALEQQIQEIINFHPVL